jgi:hypothetical protein
MKILDLEKAIETNRKFGHGENISGRLISLSNRIEGINERADDNGNEHCWSGYRKVGMKKKGGKMVNDCRPVKKGK